MKTFTTLVVIVFVSAVLLISGCSKSDDDPAGPGTGNPQLASERVNQANQIMMPRIVALFSSQGQDTSMFDMSAAISLYREALTYDNANTSAHFGLALTELVNLGSDRDVWALIQGGVKLLPAIAKGPMFLSGQYAVGVKDAISKSVLPFSAGGSPMIPFSSFTGGLLPLSSAGHPPSYYQNLLETRVLPVTADVIAHLTLLTYYPDFAFYVTSSMVGGELRDSVRIDLMEVYVILAAVQGLAGVLALPIALLAAGAVAPATSSRPRHSLCSSLPGHFASLPPPALDMALASRCAAALARLTAVHPAAACVAYLPISLSLFMGRSSNLFRRYLC